jgi:sec-independent protein translocase protein TatA
MSLGPLELIILFAVVLLLFGTRLPKVARSLGQASKEFKKGLADADHDNDDDEEKPKDKPKTS